MGSAKLQTQVRNVGNSIGVRPIYNRQLPCERAATLLGRGEEPRRTEVGDVSNQYVVEEQATNE